MTGSGHYSSEGSQGGIGFYRRRVAAFGYVAGGIFLLGFLARAIVALAIGDSGALRDPSLWFHLLGAVVLLAIWAFCRNERRSHRFVRAFEAVGLVVGCTAIQGMGAYIPHVHHPELIVTLALTLGLLARAVFVPSSARRTLALGCIIGVPLVASVFFTYLRIDRALWRATGGAWSQFGRIGIAAGMAMTTAFWWGITTTVCTATSKVIFGLREKVQLARQLGQYTLDEKLGEGAMGMVFRAHHAMLRRPTAVKLLLPNKVGEQHLARFEREVQLTAMLTHPNTVTIYDYGRTPDGIFYYAMELLEGAALDKIIEVDGAQPPERVAYLMDQIAAALAEAHGVGLIHRDIKPANIILTQQGGEPDVAKVVDFGLVKDIRGDADPQLSIAEGIAGTPLFMSPETITAYQLVDGRSDIYSLGAVCYFLLTGTHVFEADTAAEVCTKHLYAEPEPPSVRLDEPVPKDLESILLACLAKEPFHRPQSANHIRARLWAGGTLKQWNTDRARRWWRKHGDAVRAKAQPGAGPIDPGAQTIAIDLGQLDKLRQNPS